MKIGRRIKRARRVHHRCESATEVIARRVNSRPPPSCQAPARDSAQFPTRHRALGQAARGANCGSRTKSSRAVCPATRERCGPERPSCGGGSTSMAAAPWARAAFRALLLGLAPAPPGGVGVRWSSCVCFPPLRVNAKTMAARREPLWRPLDFADRKVGPEILIFDAPFVRCLRPCRDCMQWPLKLHA